MVFDQPVPFLFEPVPFLFEPIQLAGILRPGRQGGCSGISLAAAGGAPARFSTVTGIAVGASRCVRIGCYSRPVFDSGL